MGNNGKKKRLVDLIEFKNRIKWPIKTLFLFIIIINSSLFLQHTLDKFL